MPSASVIIEERALARMANRPKKAAVAAPAAMPMATTSQKSQPRPKPNLVARIAVRYAPTPRYAAWPSDGRPV